ncbi:MAG: LptA/OstA family protein [Maricaulis sp.]|jgi:lipopolysaccharide export system protein LptA|nr:LptA/OstA family protein [Maricaulis sp.]MDG2043450.1 LptA/OstA family protein [Maricaulis sp.]
MTDRLPTAIDLPKMMPPGIAMIRIAVAAVMALILGNSALAQIGDSTLPLDVGADHMENWDSERRTTLIGNVDIVQGDRRLMADHVELHHGLSETGGRGDIERIVATGNVRYYSPLQNARGDTGVYRIEDDTITLRGDVVIRQCENVITTNFFSTHLTNGDSTFGQEGNGQRVRAVLYTQENEETPEPETNTPLEGDAPATC